MIYIISGIAKAGKTYVARRMLREKAISVFSTDYLMMTLAKADPRSGVDPDADDKVVAKALEPYLYAMIGTMAENNVDHVIEGVHFLPAFAAKLQQDFPGRIRVVYLGYRNADATAKMKEILAHAGDVENAWFLSYPPAAMHRLVRYLIDESARLKLETELHGLPYVEVDDIVRQADDIVAALFR